MVLRLQREANLRYEQAFTTMIDVVTNPCPDLVWVKALMSGYIVNFWDAIAYPCPYINVGLAYRC